MPASKELGTDSNTIKSTDKLAHENWNKCARTMGERPKILPDILHTIGHTPLVELKKIPKSENIKCKMLVKCEFFNPGGSIKDRIGFRMVQDAEDRGILQPGYTVIEPTSGNTGISLAMACAVKGYKCIIVMPDNMSIEKVVALTILGAEIIRTPIDVAWNSPEGIITVTERLQKETPNSVILNQFENSANPLAHYHGTAAEILWQCDQKVDMVVMGTGTGGTATGIGRRIKETNPNCRIVAIDPYGSILARPESLNITDTKSYEVEGIGFVFVPPILDHGIIDKWIKVGDKEIFTTARRLIRDEGILCGGSSGAAMYGALQAAKDLREDQTCVVILPDGIRNYMTRFVTDNWLEAQGFKEPVNTHGAWWWKHCVYELNLSIPKTFSSSLSCEEALRYMKQNDLNQIPILKDDGGIMGAVTLTTLTTQIVSQNMQLNDAVKKAVYKKLIKVYETTNLGKIGRILETELFVFIVSPKQEITAIVTQKDLLNFILAGPSSNGNKNGSHH